MPLLRQPFLVLVYLVLAGLLSFGSAVAEVAFPLSTPFAEATSSPLPSRLALDSDRDSAPLRPQHEATLAVDRAPLPAADRSDLRSSHSGEWRYRDGRRMSGQRHLGLPSLWCGEGLDAVAVAARFRDGRALEGPSQSLSGSLVTRHIRLQV